MELNTRILTNNDYRGLTSDEAKVKELENVTKQIFSWKIVDLLRTDNELLSYFLKEKHEFGAGYGLISAGIADVFPFSTDPELRFPEERYLLKDYSAVIDNLSQNIVKLTFNNVELKKYFKNFETYQNWISLNFKRIKDTINLGIFLFLKRVFYLREEDADVNTNLKTIQTANWPILKIATEISSKLKNAKTFKIESDKSIDLYKKIIEVYSEMISEPSDLWHINQQIKGLPITIDPENMVLISSFKDKIEFEQEQLTGFYNPNFFKLPDIKTFYLNLPKGKAILIDRRALQISPFFEGTYTTFYPATLDTDIFSHFQYRIGLFDLYPAVIFHNNLGEI